MSSSPVIKLGRRHFLSGVGGFALAIPFLGSLEKIARAGDGGAAAAKVPPRYFFIGTDHGGCWNSNFLPTVTTTTSTTVPGVPGHTVSSGPLSLSTSGGKATFGGSKVLTASASNLTPSIAGKMNVLRGLDVPWYLAHNTGLLGNFWRSDGDGGATGDGALVGALGQRPTIDQLMASSSSFYSSADLAFTKAKSVIAGGGATPPHSFALTTPGNPTGGCTPVTNALGSLALFQNIFGTNPASTAKVRKPVVDLVHQNYKSLVQSSRRLSIADKTRLDQHMDMLIGLESQLSATLACTTPPTPPVDNSNYAIYGSTPNGAKWGQLYADVIAAAFFCNASRIGVYGFGQTSSLSPSFQSSGQDANDWHPNVAHKWMLDLEQGWLVESYQALYEQVFLYLANSLNGLTDSDGSTVLDNSLLVWGQECCMETHMQYDMQVVTFGGASGTMNTGLYCDYRKVGDTAVQFSPYNDAGGATGGASATLQGYVTYAGLLWDQWLATQLLAMGLTASDWELWKDSAGNPQHGYGIPFLTTYPWMPKFAAHYLPSDPSYAGGSPAADASPYFAHASNALPFLMK